jgi:hypothetical protein
MHRAAALMVVGVLVATACSDSSGSDSTPATSEPTSSESSSTAVVTVPESAGQSDIGAVAASLGQPAPLPFDEVTATAAAEAELDLIASMREDAGIAAALGDMGPAVIADVDAARQEFGETNLEGLFAELGIDLTGDPAPVTGFRSAPIARQSGGSSWTESLLGSASATVTMIMAGMAGAIDVAGRDDRAQIDSDHTYRSSPGPGIDEAVNIRTTMSLQTGGGRATADVGLVSTDTITDATGTELGRLIGTGRGRLDIGACPSPAGISEGTYELTWTEELSRPGSASAGSSMSVSAPFRLIDGDDAHLVTIETTLDVARGAHGPGTGGAPSFDWGVTARIPITVSRDGTRTIDYGGVEGSSSGATEAQVTGTVNGNLMVQLMLIEIGKAAERFWRSGECIELTTSEQSRQVEPDEQIAISTTAKGAFDGLDIDAQLSATLEGVAILEPLATKQDPPATVTYTAGSDPGALGTVTIEQVSRRGIGRASSEFTVKRRELALAIVGDYTATGLGNTLTVHVELPTTDLVIDTATSSYARDDADMSVVGTFSGNGCTAAFEWFDSLDISIARDEADRDLFRISLEIVDPMRADQTIVCPGGILGNTPIPMSDFAPLWAQVLEGVEVRVGTPTDAPTDAAQGEGSITGSTTLTITERP